MKNILFSLILLTLTSLAYAQDIESHRKAAEELMNNGSPKEALAEFQKAIDLVTEPTGNGIVFSYAGICAQQMGDDASAVNFFNQAIDRGFEDEKVFDWLGNIYKKQKNYEGQIAVYSKAAEMFPAASLKYNKSLCNAYYYSKKYDKVEALAPSIIEKDAKDTKVLGQYAGAMQRLKKTKEAKAQFEKLVELDSENLNANIFLGNYYFQYGKALEAREDAAYKKIKKPTRVQWAESNKKIEKIRGEYYGKTILHLKKVYDKKPDESTKKMLFAVYTKLGDAENAEKFK